MWECWHRLGDDAVASFLGGWGQGGQLPSPRKILPPPRKIKEIFYFVGGPSPLQAIKLIYFFSSKMFQYLKKKKIQFYFYFFKSLQIYMKDVECAESKKKSNLRFFFSSYGLFCIPVFDEFSSKTRKI